MRSKAYLSIEGLRGVLAVCVCFGHYGLGSLFELFHLQFQFHFAVDIFFVISGFVLSYANYYAQSTLTAYQFTLKRFARLYPLHFLTLLLMVWLSFVSEKNIALDNFLVHALVMHNIGIFPNNNSFNFPSWSISVEIWSSLLFFYLTQCFGNKKIFLITTLIVFIISCCLIFPQILMYGAYHDTSILNYGLLRGLMGTSLGVILFLSTQYELIRKLLFKPMLGWLSVTGLALFFLFQLPEAFSLYFYLFSFIFLGNLVTSPFLKMLSSPIFIWLGTISYSLYLLHIPLYCALQTLAGDPYVKGYQGKLLLLPVLFLLASAVYKFFELPAQQFIKTHFQRTLTCWLAKARARIVNLSNIKT